MAAPPSAQTGAAPAGPQYDLPHLCPLAGARSPAQLQLLTQEQWGAHPQPAAWLR